MRDKVINLGIVGLGHVADFQLDALRRLTEKYLLVAVCDRNAECFVKAPGVRAFTEVEVLLDEVDVDCLLISVPNRDHYAVAHSVLSRDVPVLLEKPATENIEQFEHLCALAAERALMLHTAYHAAFARELLWFLTEWKQRLQYLGPITGIRCGFYDPYIQNDALVPAAESLGGSWIDSGINALSVVAKLVDDFTIEGVRLTRSPGYDCEQIQGSVDFTFPIEANSNGGQGLIDTNWALDRNHKSTELFFARSGCRVTLDHTRQRVELVNGSGERSTLVDLAKELPRMTAHYVGVFNDLYERFEQRSDNRELSLNLLKKLYIASTT